MRNNYYEGNNYIVSYRGKWLSINKYLYWFYILLYVGLIAFSCAYGILTTKIALVLTLVGSVGVSWFAHRLNNTRKSLKVHALNILYISIALLIGYCMSPTVRQLHSCLHSGGGFYWLKAVVMLIPAVLNLKFVAFKYFAHSVNEEIKA